MIPVELFGINADMVERFYDELPGLVEDAFEDKPYVDALFAIEAERSLEHLNIADGWAKNTPLVWNDDLENEVLSWHYEPSRIPRSTCSSTFFHSTTSTPCDCPNGCTSQPTFIQSTLEKRVRP